MMEEREFDEAIKKLNEMLKDQPGDAILLHNLGVAYTEKNMWPEAEAQFTAAWDAQKLAKKVNYATMYGLATVLTEQNEPGKLLQAEALFHDFLEKAISQEEQGIPETYRAFTGLADNLERQKRWLEAGECWRQSLDLATAMFGEKSERAVSHKVKMDRAHRLARWQRNMRYGLWMLTLAVPLGFGWQMYRSEEQTALGQALSVFFGVGGSQNAANAELSHSGTAEL